MNACKEKAYAKINLFLDCISRRPDGFHNIKSVMHSVSLYDDVTVTLGKTGKRNIRVILDGNRRLPTDNKNLVYVAAERFMDKAAIDADITIRLDKRIPISAGLAGGSSDAAATLRAMNRLFNRCFTERILLDIAAEIGSDVPYCLVGGTHLCEGRGEVLTRLDSTRELFVVIAIENERVSTPMAYGTLDELYSDFDGTISTGGDEYYPQLLHYLSGGEMPEGLFNCFEKAVFPLCPGAMSLKARMLELGAKLSLMSGSGPSVFGIFDTEDLAEAAKHALSLDGTRAFVAKSVT